MRLDDSCISAQNYGKILSYHVQTDLGAGYGIKRSVNIVWGALELRIGG